jgi:hypothetical protein
VGRYLLEVNTHLARSLRMRWKRWREAWSSADGLVHTKDRAGRGAAGGPIVSPIASIRRRRSSTSRLAHINFY